VLEALLTPQIILLLLILAAAVVFFSFEWVPADVVALGILLALVLTGLVPADRAFTGFGSDTVMVFLGLLIMTAALLRTGVVDQAGRWILRRAGKDPQRLLVLVVVAVATLGVFISNTASTAFFLPVVMAIAARTSTSPSRLLMPLAFGSILTSSVTLISTSTNIVVSGLMQQMGLPPIHMFELAPVGIPIAVVGIVYVLTLGRRLMPDRSQPGLEPSFGLGPYLTEVVVAPNSRLIGKTLRESGLGSMLDLTVVKIVREKTRYLAPRANMRLAQDDVLLVEGRRQDVLKIKDVAGIDIKADVDLADPELQAEDVRLVEGILLPGSPLIGRTLRSHQFRERYGLQVLAIHRHDETLTAKLSTVRLRMGDVLLLQGDQHVLAGVEGNRSFRILGLVDEPRPKLHRARTAVVVFASAMLLGTLKVVSLPVAMLLGALGAFLTGCITPEEAYREVEWKVIIFVGSMLALGAAMEATGTAQYLAAQVVRLAAEASPVWLLTAFFALTVLLTQPMSNQAAAVVVLPVAIQAALQLQLNPRTFAMMVAVAASCSYMTPLEPSCLMVYGPGRYRFIDFIKVGLPLTAVIGAIAVVLVPRVWPL
jgi:di/tricarboxylate transporter